MSRKSKLKINPDKLLEYSVADNIPELDLHLDDNSDLTAWLENRYNVGEVAARINHGKGTGELRKKVHSTLDEHRIVQKYAYALTTNCLKNNGVTVVYFRKGKK